MEAKFEEERRCRMEIEAKLEQEQKLREEQSVMLHSMVTWMQGLGASMNYATPPPPSPYQLSLTFLQDLLTLP